MKAGPEAPRDGAEKRIGRGMPSRLFTDRAEELARGLAALERRVPARTPAPEIRLGDARDLGFVADASVALVVSSPPYAGTYDYAAQHDVRFTWLELPRRSFRDTQIGARTAGLGADARAWRESQRRWIGEIARVLAPGRPRDAGRRRRRRRRPGRGRARRGRERRRTRWAWSRSRAPRRRAR